MWFTQSTKILGTFCVSCLHRLWYCVTFCSSWKEDCMESLGDTWWIHCNNLLWAAQCTLAKSNGWRDRIFCWYFSILLYDTRVTGSSINKVRKNLFIHKGRQMSGLSPTKADPRQHMNRAVLQGGHYWDCTTLAYWQLPSPVEWGWTCRTVEVLLVKLAWSQCNLSRAAEVFLSERM